jgi:serine/threonine protein kinase
VVKLLASDIVTQRAIKEAVLLLEYCPGGHLLERLNNRAGAYLPAPNVYRIFGQLLLGIQSLHESDPPITHRDLKLENILFGTVSNAIATNTSYLILVFNSNQGLRLD